MPDSLQPPGFQPCKDDEEAEDRQCVSQQGVETVAQKDERQQQSLAHKPSCVHRHMAHAGIPKSQACPFRCARSHGALEEGDVIDDAWQEL